MDYRLDIGMWNRVFAVPCALVDRHLKLAGKEQLQVVLFALRHAGEGFTPESLAQALGMTVEQALDGLEYWCDRGLLSQSGQELLPLPQAGDAAMEMTAAPAPEPEAPAAVMPEAVQAPPEKPALPPRKRLLRPDGEHLTARLAESENVRFLMQEAESTLGKTLSPAMSSLLLTITDDYGLPAEVTVMLLHYAKEIGRTGTSYIDSVARDWAESSIFSLEAAEEKLQQLSKARLAWGRVSAAAGLSKRSPSKSEEEKACRWVYEWGFQPEMLSAAYEVCADHTGKFSASYMDKVLTGWHKLNITDLKALEQHRQAAAAKKESKTGTEKSYDTDTLEQLSILRLPDKL